MYLSEAVKTGKLFKRPAFDRHFFKVDNVWFRCINDDDCGATLYEIDDSDYRINQKKYLLNVEDLLANDWMVKNDDE